MKAAITFSGHNICITTEHATSSYGIPVVLVDDELTDLEVRYTPDVADATDVLDVVADLADVWHGPTTRRALHVLGAEMYPDGIKSGADADAVVAEFKRRGKALRAAEEAAANS